MAHSITRALAKRLTRFAAHDAGNITIISTLALVPFMFAAGVAIDYSRGVTAKTGLQQISDAAALAAAAPDNVTTAQRKDIALKYIDQNEGVLNGIDIKSKQVVVGPNTVDVTLKAIVEGTLTKVAEDNSGQGAAENGGGNFDADMKIGSHSKAAFGKDSYKCLLSLSPTDYEAVRFYGNAEFMASVCTVHANSNNNTAMRTQGSAYAQAEDFCARGGWAGSGFEPDPTGGCKLETDPYADLEMPSVPACTGAPDKDYDDNMNFTLPHHKSATINPGIFCGGLTLGNHSTLNLNPGVYIIKDGKIDIAADATINAVGVTFYLVGTSSVTITSGSHITITAPTTGTYKSMALIQDPSSNPGVWNYISSGGDVNITGAWYTPTQNLTVWANGDMNTGSPYFPIVVNKFEMSGDATLYVKLDWKAAGYDEPLSLKTPKYVLLGE
jgi:Flp pilus assembly protein TadG